MKKIIMICLVVFAMSLNVFAAPGDTIPDKENGMWQLAAGGVLGQVITVMNQMPSGFAGSSSRNLFVPWMQITFARSSSVGIAFPDDVYYGVLDRIQGYNYGRARYLKRAYPPKDASVSGDTITCVDDRDDGRTPLLYIWDGTDYTESDIAGVLGAGTWTFSAVPSGEYVLAYDDGFSLPTTTITVP